MGCSGAVGARLAKGEGDSSENHDTTGRITSSRRFMPTEVMASISTSRYTHMAPERCRSKLSLWPPLFQRNANERRHAAQLGNEIHSAIKVSNTQATAIRPINHMPNSMPKPSGMCML
ncbi:MAG: hypothetical protein Tsb007_15910 [Rhizobacter sp.]